MSRNLYAHEWEVIGGPERIARFPSKIGEKRNIRVEITSWIGLSIGAKHHSVNVEEQRNSWWSESENAWVELSCDSQNRGYSMRAEVLTEEEAIKLAKHFIKIIAGSKRLLHTVCWTGKGRPTWAN